MGDCWFVRKGKGSSARDVPHVEQGETLPWACATKEGKRSVFRLSKQWLRSIQTSFSSSVIKLTLYCERVLEKCIPYCSRSRSSSGQGFREFITTLLNAERHRPPCIGPKILSCFFGTHFTSLSQHSLL